MTGPGAPRTWREWDRIVDVLLAVLLLAVAAQLVYAWSLRDGPATVRLWAGAGITTAFAVAMLVRRRYPVTIALAAVVTAAATLASPLVLAAALFTLASERRDRVTVAVIAAAVAGIVASVVVGFPGAAPAATALRLVANLALGVVVPVAAGAYLGAWRDLVVSRRLRAEHAENEQNLLADRARRSERARIAREMHDTLAHRVSMVALHAGALEVNPAAGPDTVEREAALIGEHARTALAELREILGVLRADERPETGDAPQPTVEAIGRLVESGRRVGQDIDLRYDLDGHPPEPAGRAAYRVVQEGLTNVGKHAPHAAVTVRVGGTPGATLDVEVHNTRAPGSAPAGPAVPGSGSGLVGLGERVHVLGGTFDARPDDGGGFTVRAALPWPS